MAGPSGVGKSHLARVLGWSVLRLDDFYREGDDPDLPRSDLGLPDWDDPGSWDAVAAVGTSVMMIEKHYGHLVASAARERLAKVQIL